LSLIALAIPGLMIYGFWTRTPELIGTGELERVTIKLTKTDFVELAFPKSEYTKSILGWPVNIDTKPDDPGWYQSIQDCMREYKEHDFFSLDEDVLIKKVPPLDWIKENVDYSFSSSYLIRFYLPAGGELHQLASFEDYKDEKKVRKPKHLNYYNQDVYTDNVFAEFTTGEYTYPWFMVFKDDNTSYWDKYLYFYPDGEKYLMIKIPDQYSFDLDQMLLNIKVGPIELGFDCEILRIK